MDSGGDARRARGNFTRRADGVWNAPGLAQELARRLLEHLDGLRLEPARILAAGPCCRVLADLLVEAFPEGQLWLADPVPALLQRQPALRGWRRWLGRRAPPAFSAEPDALPLPNGSINLLVVFGGLLWHRPERVFAEARRVLAGEGLVLFVTLGPDTFRQWRSALAAAHPDEGDPSGRRLLRLADMHDLADMAGHAGLASPVVDMEYLTVHYRDAASLYADLQNAGGNALRERPRGLMTPRALARLEAVLASQRVPEGLPQTLEVIYGHAWNLRPLVDAAGRPVIPIRSAPGQ